MGFSAKIGQELCQLRPEPDRVGIADERYAPCRPRCGLTEDEHESTEPAEDDPAGSDGLPREAGAGGHVAILPDFLRGGRSRLLDRRRGLENSLVAERQRKAYKR